MWTSEAPFRHALILSLFLAAPGFWGKDKSEPPPEHDATAEPAPRPEPTGPEVRARDRESAPIHSLFPDGLPVSVGPVPEGLANVSAQGCNACHYAAHDGWAGSKHATGWSRPAFQDAARAVGTPACTVCHLPLVEQTPSRAAYTGGDPNRVEHHPNPSYDATLSGEGVTCAACHVRDGVVIAARPPTGPAPHPIQWSDTLTTSAFCASCHQLTWPGADKPFYDTYREWERSPQGQAGVQCQDCHMGAGAGARVGSDHSFHADPARALSLLVEVDRVDLARGGHPLDVRLRLQNTGAGHAVPTGSPFGAIVLRARLVGGPQSESDAALERSPFEAVLGRVLADDPPWITLEDTRLQAGGERTWSWLPALDIDDPAGPWWLEISLHRQARGQPLEAPFVVRRVALDVD